MRYASHPCPDKCESLLFRRTRTLKLPELLLFDWAIRSAVQVKMTPDFWHTISRSSINYSLTQVARSLVPALSTWIAFNSVHDHPNARSLITHRNGCIVSYLAKDDANYIQLNSVLNRVRRRTRQESDEEGAPNAAMTAYHKVPRYLRR